MQLSTTVTPPQQWKEVAQSHFEPSFKRVGKPNCDELNPKFFPPA